MKNIDEIFEKRFLELPEKVLQIGEGNFIRSFADYAIEIMNEKGHFNGRVVVCPPRSNKIVKKLNSQQCLYSVVVRGQENSKTVDFVKQISCVSRCIYPNENFKELLELAVSTDLQVVISNTTEAGLVFNKKDKFTDEPPVSYPAKLTVILFKRFEHFNGELDKGLVILPLELIDSNGDKLKELVISYAKLWNLDLKFIEWIKSSLVFCSTLVDRIVSGFPKDNSNEIFQQIGYKDYLLSVSEPYFSWIIEGDDKARRLFPVEKTGLNVVWTDNLKPYRDRKVRVLNGTHTMSALAAFHSNIDIVRDMMNDSVLLKFIKIGVFKEIIPTIDMPEYELKEFANSVIERFENPFINHNLIDISLNSVSKFNSRCVPTILDYIKYKNSLPKILIFGLTALIYFYKGEFIDGIFMGKRNKENYIISDSIDVLEFFDFAYKQNDPVKIILSNEKFWGMNLTTIEGLYKMVIDNIKLIEENSMKFAIDKLVNNYE